MHKRRGEMSLRKKIITGIFSLLFLLCLLVVHQNVFADGVPALVETQWLADNLKKSDIRIVYVGGMAKDDKAKFDSKHILGSVYLGIGDLMDAMGDGSSPPDKTKFEALMGKLGISNDTHVIIYGVSGRNPFIAGAFWLMEYFGHKKVSYLNGGMAKWDKEGHKTTGSSTKITSTTYKAVPDASIYADADYVLKNLKNPKAVIIDTRSIDEYKGTKNVGNNKKTGHIPGAINLSFYSTNLKKDGTFKSIKDLRAAYESEGITKDKEVITYCQGGVRAAHTYFVLKHLLDYPKVRVYVGSWGEWGNRLDTAKYPIEK